MREAHNPAAMGGNLVGSLGRLCCAEPGDLRATTRMAGQGWPTSDSAC
jgi:hypothetical protein